MLALCFRFTARSTWIGLETEITILDGRDVPHRLVAFMRARHGDTTPEGMILGHDEALGNNRLYAEEEFIQQAEAEQRMIYEFHINEVYGNY